MMYTAVGISVLRFQMLKACAVWPISAVVLVANWIMIAGVRLLQLQMQLTQLHQIEC